MAENNEPTNKPEKDNNAHFPLDVRVSCTDKTRRQAQRVKKLRGKAWYEEYQKLIEIAEPELIRCKKEIDDENGKFTVADLFALADHFQMYLKNTTEILEDSAEIKQGTWQALKNDPRSQEEYREQIYKCK